MSQSGTSIRQNLIKSTILGPLRAVVPALIAIVFYPILLHAGGLRLVGTWTILQLIVSYIGLCAAGLPSLAMRKVAGDGAGPQTIEALKLILGIYLLSGLALLLVVISFAEPAWRLVQLPLQSSVLAPLCTVVLAGAVANVASLYAAVLSGLHRYYVAQMSETAGAVVQFLVAVSFVLMGWPMVGMAAGLLAGKVAILVLVMIDTKSQAPQYCIRPSLGFAKIFRLLREGKSFILFNIGTALLDPLARGLLLLMASPSELALFDIANRLPALIRNSFTYGLMALFPAVTALRAQQREAGIERIMRASLGVVVFLIVTPLAVYLIFSEPALSAWLGTVGVQASTITLITTAWWVVTAYNVPFYLTIQAVGLESVVARNIWLHLVLMMVGGVALNGIGVDAMTVSWLMLITGIISQMQFYIEVQARARLLSIAFARRRDRVVAVASLVMLASAVYLRIDTTSLSNLSFHVLSPTVVFFGIWLVTLGIFTSGRPLRFFLQTLRPAPNPADGA